jgi:hypothetical protein
MDTVLFLETIAPFYDYPRDNPLHMGRNPTDETTTVSLYEDDTTLDCTDDSWFLMKVFYQR